MVEPEYFLKNHRKNQYWQNKIEVLFLGRSGYVINIQILGNILHPVGGLQEGKSTWDPDGNTGITSLAKLFPWYEI